jgi:predicted ATPase
MNERFKLLASTGGRIDRQTTLQAVFDWSWNLLSLPEKAALAQLSVFEGGFTLESVEAVLDLSAYEKAPWPMDALQSLVQKSLVRQTTDNRFDLLVSVQEYAAEQLRTAARYVGSGSGGATRG